MRKLTEIQLKILGYLDSGMSAIDISNQTMTNESTVRAHIGRILKKTRCRSLFQLGKWAAANVVLESYTRTIADRDLHA